MDYQTPEQTARDLLSKLKVCGLATASKTGKPEAAMMNFTPVGGGSLSVYFNTFVGYRKYANLKSNPRASIVVTDKQPESWNTYSLQMDGRVRELTGVAKTNARAAMMRRFRKDPLYDDPGFAAFQFTPTWARLLDYQKETPRFRVLKLP